MMSFVLNIGVLLSGYWYLSPEWYRVVQKDLSPGCVSKVNLSWLITSKHNRNMPPKFFWYIFSDGFREKKEGKVTQRCI